MLVFQNKATGRFVRRLYKEEYGSSIDTYKHVDQVEDATVFAGWWDISTWMEARAEKAYGPLPSIWRLVEVELVTQPKITIIKEIG